MVMDEFGIKYITNMPHSVLTRYVNAPSTLWHSYTDDHRGQQISTCDSALITLYFPNCSLNISVFFCVLRV